MPVTIKGMDRLLSELDAFGANIPRALGVAGRKAMVEAIEKPAKKACPVDNGRLRASINTVAQIGASGANIQTGTNVFYGVYVEYGTGIYAVNGNGRKTPWAYVYTGKKGPQGVRITRGQKPHPFLGRAVEFYGSSIPDKVAESLKAQIAKACEKKRLAAISEEV
jgi:HK97 gp10 family phage protein